MTEHAPDVLELRQYLLHRHRRDELIELFDRELVETQEACGIRVIGQFRDVDRPNHFVWLRGFADHESRGRSLAAFYDGPVWARHGLAAAATMIDSDDVLQLRSHPSEARSLVIHPPGERPAAGTAGDGNGNGCAVIVVAHRTSGQVQIQDGLVLPRLARLADDVGLTVRGVHETDPAPNAFPRLPVRPANCLVWMASGGSQDDQLRAAAEQMVAVRAEVHGAAVEQGLDEVRIDLLRLVPTGRSTFSGDLPATPSPG